ncbi:hypothetical protein EC9_02120 [Rosistilla ulvae]|uniref:RedB protein n=1 Tax=Rosistilla ulvae TaxID=1930277 RepID=A0A517LTU2_9BACT|nr:hypothetical protein [Rosistilla ulvae]QDS86054.1 hypothetical protein EC9_02120 [Rosistilla ulvae]
MLKTTVDGPLAADRSVLCLSPQTRRTWFLVTIGWLVAVAGCFAWITDYGLRTNPSNLSQDVANWPSQSSLPLADQSPTLVLFLHPKCSCSEATVGELQKILSAVATQSSPLPNTLIVASMPTNEPSDWRDSRLNQRAQTLPNSTLVPDHQGIECARFGVNTSGTVMLFDPAGKQLFSGGVTTARGQAGESRAGGWLRTLLTQHDATHHPHPDRDMCVVQPAFGCKLLSPPASLRLTSSTLPTRESNR